MILTLGVRHCGIMAFWDDDPPSHQDHIKTYMQLFETQPKIKMNHKARAKEMTTTIQKSSAKDNDQ